MKTITRLFYITLLGSTFVACKPNAAEATKTDSKPEVAKEIAAVHLDSTRFHIEGMTCAVGCAKTIEAKLNETTGVQKAVVDFDKKEATVEFDAAVLTPEKLTKTVESTGDGETYKVSEMQTKGKV